MRELVWQLALHTGEEGVGHFKYVGKSMNGLFKANGQKTRELNFLGSRDTSKLLSLPIGLRHLDVV